ncbi:MAG: tetratricopeptide repeat protein [Phycisphaerae bacterium]
MRRVMSVTWDRRVGGLLPALGVLACMLSGCQSPTRPVGDPVKLPWLPPIQPPAGFDRQRAALSLAQIPDDPPAPAIVEERQAELPEATRRQLSEAREHLSKGRHTEALGLLEQLLRGDAGVAEAHRLVAVASLMAGNDERAGLSAGRALTLRPGDLISHYVVGRLAEKRRDTAGAIRAYRTGLKCKVLPEEAHYLVLTHYRLGLLLDQERYYLAAAEQLGLFEKGIRSLGSKVEESVELASIVRLQRGTVASRMARAHSYLGDYSAAADAMKIAVAESPKDLDLRADYVRMLAHAGRLDEAMAESRRLVADSQGNREAVELLLGLHRAAGRPEAGVAAMRDAVAGQPENLDLNLLYCEALVDAGRYGQAVSILKELTDRFPKSSEAKWRLVSIQRLRQDWSGWLLALAQLLASDPVVYEKANRELDLAPSSITGRMAAEASSEAAPRQLVPPQPQEAVLSAAMDYLLGHICDRLDRIEEARMFFDRSAASAPGFLPAIMGVAELYMHRCRWDEAIVVLKKVAEARPPSHLVERLLGQCYDALDDTERAVEHYQAAIKINGEDVRGMMLLAGLHERRDENREAQRQYQAVISVNPNYMPGREAYIRSLMSAGGGFTSAVVAGRVALEFAEMQRRGPRDPATIRTAALLRFLQDRDRESYAGTLRSLIQAHPEDERSREDLAASLIAFRDYQTAREVLAQTIADFPQSGQAGWMMAMTLTRLLEFDTAAAEYERILAIHPNRTSYLQALAELRMTQQRFEAAIPVYERLLELQSKDGFPGLHRGRLMEAYRRLGRLDDARRLAEHWLAEVDPKAKTAGPLAAIYRWFVLAADEAAKDYDAYLCRCREWLKSDPEDANARAWLIGLTTDAPIGTVGSFRGYGGLMGAGRHDEAVTQVVRWLDKSPTDTRLMRLLADVFVASRRFDEAIELQRSLAAATTKADEKLVLLYSLQTTYSRARRYDDAIATVREWMNTAQRLSGDNRSLASQELDGAVFEQRRTIGMLMAQQGRTDEAIAYLTGLLAQQPDDSRRVELLRGLSYIFQRRGQHGPAEEHLRQAYQLMPTDVGLNNDLGYTLAEAGKDLAEAERMLRLAVGESPRQAAYLDSLGWVFYKQGRFEDACCWLQLAAGQEHGEDAVIHDHLGDACWRKGQKAKAADHWRQALELYERQLADGVTERNDTLLAGLRGKLAAVAANQEPTVAPLAVMQGSAPAK